MWSSIQASIPSSSRRGLGVALGIVAGRAGGVEEAGARVVGERRELLGRDRAEHHAAAEQPGVEAGPLLLEEGEDAQRQVEPLVGREAGDLQRDDDAEGAVVGPAVAVGVAVRADPQARLTAPAVRRDERPDRVVPGGVAELREGVLEPAQGPLVLRDPGVPGDAGGRGRVVRTTELRDRVLDPLAAALERPHPRRDDPRSAIEG